MKIDFSPLGFEHYQILKHTQKNKLFCGDSEFMQELVKQGLMESAGKKPFVPDEYFRLTNIGHELLETAQRLIN